MVRSRLDAAKALSAAPVFGREEMQFVEPLLAERQSAFGAVDFKVMLHLAAGGDPVSFDGAAGAAGEAEECAADVVDFDPALAALAVGSLGDHGDAIAHDAGDRAC